MRSAVTLGVGAIAAAFLAGYVLQPDEQACIHAETLASTLAPHMPLSDIPPNSSDVYSPERGMYTFGRWRMPLQHVTFHTDGDWTQPLAGLLHQKRWHYLSFNTREYFVGANLLGAGYLSDAMLYVVDKKTKKWFEFHGRTPGSIGYTTSASSIDAHRCTSFQAPFQSQRVECCYDATSSEWIFRANVRAVATEGNDVLAFATELHLAQQEALVLSYPLANLRDRIAYTHKAAGMPLHGWLQVDGKRVQIEPTDSYGAMDWTRGMALRCTRWKWASASFQATVTTYKEGEEPERVENAIVGINFSADVYDVEGESQENAVWVNGKVYQMRGVHFRVPEHPTKQLWHLETISKSNIDVEAESVQLSFSPMGSREDHLNILLVESDFVQPFGTFHGSIRLTTERNERVQIEIQNQNAFGVVENHKALW